MSFRYPPFFINDRNKNVIDMSQGSNRCLRKDQTMRTLQRCAKFQKHANQKWACSTTCRFIVVLFVVLFAILPAASQNVVPGLHENNPIPSSKPGGNLTQEPAIGSWQPG